MGMEIPEVEDEEEQVIVVEKVEQRRGEMREARLKSRPGILLVGPPAVGKRSILSRLVARGRSAQATSESGATCHGWTIDTKYYTANVCMWTALLDNPYLENNRTMQSEFGRLEALVMVFDLSNSNSFRQLQEWVTGVELRDFEILLCVGNKADRVPDHFAHAGYRRKLQKKGESSSDPHPEFWDFGIDRTEGSSLLDEEEDSAADRRRSCIEWCSERGIEYIEACAINEVFDECMSVDGDLQGVPRICGALSAHMWPGLVMKDRSESNEATLSQHEEEEMTSDDDSDYYIEYELLSNDPADPWEASGWEEQWSFSSHVELEPAHQDNGSLPLSTDDPPANIVLDSQQVDSAPAPVSVPTDKPITDGTEGSQTDIWGARISSNRGRTVEHHGAIQNDEVDQGAQPSDRLSQNGHKNQELDDMEQLMSEMTTMRSNMGSMSDQQRREMAAQLAMRMASMFNEDEESDRD